MTNIKPGTPKAITGVPGFYVLVAGHIQAYGNASQNPLPVQQQQCCLAIVRRLLRYTYSRLLGCTSLTNSCRCLRTQRQSMRCHSHIFAAVQLIVSLIWNVDQFDLPISWRHRWTVKLSSWNCINSFFNWLRHGCASDISLINLALTLGVVKDGRLRTTLPSSRSLRSYTIDQGGGALINLRFIIGVNAYATNKDDSKIDQSVF